MATKSFRIRRQLPSKRDYETYALLEAMRDCREEWGQIDASSGLVSAQWIRADDNNQEDRLSFFYNFLHRSEDAEFVLLVEIRSFRSSLIGLWSSHRFTGFAIDEGISTHNNQHFDLLIEDTGVERRYAFDGQFYQPVDS